ncbi:hypothetical protein PQQ75_25380 [Paraburkholderia aspalathi]|uniref:hypothetical protein n=1 Tax=Paraburkholderia aspalathi TaxID=1324617 RepID=UPI0038B7B07C
MSKMTPQQKAANKAAQKVRDKAFAARRREYRKALDAAKAAANESPAALERDAAHEAVDAEVSSREAALRNIRQQITRLEEEAARVKSVFDAPIEAKRVLQRAASGRFNDHREALTEQIEALYPDMKGCFYVSQWAIPADVQVAMDAAAASAKVPV